MSEMTTDTDRKRTRTYAKRANDYITAAECADLVNMAVRDALLHYHVHQESQRWTVRLRAFFGRPA